LKDLPKRKTEEEIKIEKAEARRKIEERLRALSRSPPTRQPASRDQEEPSRISKELATTRLAAMERKMRESQEIDHLDKRLNKEIKSAITGMDRVL